MKHLLSLLILSFSIGVCSAQVKDTTYFVRDGNTFVKTKNGITQLTVGIEEDSLTASRFITDSIGNEYMVEYRYGSSDSLKSKWGGMGQDAAYRPDTSLWISTSHMYSHMHYIALCSIIKFKGNKQQVIMSGIKAIYSPTDCSSDNEKLWLERLKKYKQ